VKEMSHACGEFSRAGNGDEGDSANNPAEIHSQREDPDRSVGIEEGDDIAPMLFISSLHIGPGLYRLS
jgi:hypothetical protein